MTLAAKILSATSTLSRAERRIARILHATNFQAGVVPVAALASQADVSGPTVIRFTTKLGYDSYRDFQIAAGAQFGERIESPATLYQRGLEDHHKHDLDQASQSIARCVEKTFEMLDRGELDKVVKILANRRRHICTIGGQASRFFAEMLAARLYQIRPNVRAAGPHGLGFAAEDQLPFFGRRDVVVAIDFRRYQESTISFASVAASKGATIILITDTWLSPVADFASHVLTIYSDSGWPYDIWTPCMGLIEAVLQLVLSEMGPEAVGQRIRLTEQYSTGLLGMREPILRDQASEGEE